MNLINDLIELFYEQLSSLYDLTSVRYQLHIPDSQSFLQIRIHIHIFEKLVTLIDNFVVMIEIVEIEIVQLAQFHIYKSSPLRGTIFNDSQVFRRKKHNITKPQKIRCFLDLLAIYGNSFGFGLSQMHIHTDFFTVFLEISSDMCLFLVEINDFSVLASLMRFCGGSYIDCFQNIGLALRIVSVEDICPPVKLQDKRIIIPVICQFD